MNLPELERQLDWIEQIEKLIRAGDLDALRLRHHDRALTVPIFAISAVRFGRLDALELLDELGTPIVGGAASKAFDYGHPEILEYLYANQKPYESQIGPDTIHPRCQAFYDEHGKNWAAGIYRTDNKPAKKG